MLRSIWWMMFGLGCAPVFIGDTGVSTSSGPHDTSSGSGGSDDTSASDSGDSGSGSGDSGGGGGDVVVCINEFMASNNVTTMDESGVAEDWVELHNPGVDDVSLDGTTITDDFDEPDKHSLDGLSLPAGDFLLLWADGDEKEGAEHLSFSLDADGEALGLYSANGTALQLLEFDAQLTDVSAARTTDCGSSWDFTESPTPGASNEG
jgi:hypothetical protein